MSSMEIDLLDLEKDFETNRHRRELRGDLYANSNALDARKLLSVDVLNEREQGIFPRGGGNLNYR